MPDMADGKANAADVAFFVLWLVVVLVPIFSEIKLGSLVELKQHIEQANEELKRDVREEIGELRIEVRSAVDVRANISPQFNFPTPPRDEQLPQIEQTIKAAIAQALQDVRAATPAKPALQGHVSESVTLLFQTRYAIEVELRRIAEINQFSLDDRRPISGLRLAHALAQREILPSSLINAIREVYAVCSPAIHGAPVTEAQVEFVRDVGPALIAALRAHERPILAAVTAWAG